MKTILANALLLLLAIIPLGAQAQSNKARQTAKVDETAIAQRTQEIRDSINAIMQKADAGDAEAMNEVGLWYYTGRHVKQDYNKAREWWSNAALKGNVLATGNLGMCYQYGRGVERDSVDAIRLYAKSIKDGNQALLVKRGESAPTNAFDAMLVAHCYEKGILVKKDLTKAASFYAMAAGKGSVDGMRQAAMCYLNAKNNASALKYFEMGADHNDPACLYWAGKLLMDGTGMPQNINQGMVYMLKAAEGGMPAAQNEVGNCYAEGKGVTKNLETAAQWYAKAAKQGHEKGMWNYGLALKNGQGVARDYDQALFWMAEAGAKGYSRSFARMIAQLDSAGNDPFVNYVYGIKFYYDGDMKQASEQFKKVEKAKIDEGKIMQAVVQASKRNEKPNAKKAAKTLEQLAETNAEAAFYLATLYETGNGVDQDMARAISLYSSAADMGYGKAQSYLADIYYEGRGTDKDLITAVALYRKALENRQLSQKGATHLADCYETGAAGLAQDPEMAEQLRKAKYTDNLPALLKRVEIKNK